MSDLNLIEDNIGNFKDLYGDSEQILKKQRTRYEHIIKEFKSYFKSDVEALFSSPGRTEISGNHTDHNQGKVLASSINLDTIAAVRKNDNIIRIRSEGYDPIFEVKLDDLDKKAEEKGSTNALIRGIASKFYELDFEIGGFDAYFSSQVGVGSGLSSSASIEVMIGIILNHLYNSGNIDSVKIAQIGQYAENQYFEKPCGLMDQLAISVGGVLEIDFKSNHEPKIKQTSFNKAKSGFDIVIVDTGGNHADLTEDYASIPTEMKAIAQKFGKKVCREFKMEQLVANIESLRETVNDRAILRCLHFFNENRRVDDLADAIAEDDYDRFLKIIQASGDSSFKYLQNCYTTKNPLEQGISLALGLSEYFLQENNCRGACRVHGGGFAGTIQTFIDEYATQEYIEFIENIFGKNSATKIQIRDFGGIQIA